MPASTMSGFSMIEGAREEMKTSQRIGASFCARCQSRYSTPSYIPSRPGQHP
jgi:hypothetical protein